MTRHKQPTEAELSVLKLLWQRAPQSARQLTRQLYPRTSTSDIATVQKLLQRLEAKRLVKRDRAAYPHEFHPLVSRDDFAARQLTRMADDLTGGSLVPFLTHLVRGKRLSSKEKQQLRKLLEDYL